MTCQDNSTQNNRIYGKYLAQFDDCGDYSKYYYIWCIVNKDLLYIVGISKIITGLITGVLIILGSSSRSKVLFIINLVFLWLAYLYCWAKIV